MPAPTPAAASPSASRASAWAAWAVLLALELTLVVAACTFDRARWPTPIGDEATYAMQAESLAFDRDLLYTRGDFDRYLARWGHPPAGLILQSGDRGATLTFGKPVFYAAFLAPFVRLARQGPFVANALLLLAASLVAARALRPTVGSLAPLWIAVAVFASVSFVFVFWVHADLFLLCLLALALSLVVGEGKPPAGPGWVRWATVGALLAVIGFSRPFYLALFLPALAAAWGRRRAVAALLAGALVVLLGAAGGHRALAGSLTGYGASRAGFYPQTGFPEVDFPASAWEERLATTTGDHAWRLEAVEEKLIRPSLWGWNAVYFLVGRDVGLLPYFLPAALGLLALLGAPRSALRWGLVAAVALAVAAFFWWRPFNFYGGGGTIANRYFLPLYAACWFLPNRRLRWLPLLAVPLLAAPFLVELWRHPTAYPIGDDGAYRYVTPAARRFLPYETSQSHLQLAGREDVYAGVFLRFLSTGLGTAGEGVLTAPAGPWEELLLGSGDDIAAVELVTTGAGGLEVAGKAVEPAVSAPDDPAGSRRFRVELGRPAARHPLWWTWQPVDLWVLRLRFVPEAAGAVAFRVVTTSPPTPSP